MYSTSFSSPGHLNETDNSNNNKMKTKPRFKQTPPKLQSKVWKGRTVVIICRWNDCPYGKPQNLYRKILGMSKSLAKMLNQNKTLIVFQYIHGSIAERKWTFISIYLSIYLSIIYYLSIHHLSTIYLSIHHLPIQICMYVYIYCMYILYVCIHIHIYAYIHTLLHYQTTRYTEKYLLKYVQIEKIMKLNLKQSKKT
jgi:hypothetical protein